MDNGERRKPLRCRFGLHTLVTRVNAGARWQECGRCGKYTPQVDMSNRYPPSGTGEEAGGG